MMPTLDERIAAFLASEGGYTAAPFLPPAVKEPLRFYVGVPDFGEPEVEVHGTLAADIPPGAGVWDSTDRIFHFTVPCDVTARTGWTALAYEDGTVEHYEPGIRLQVAERAAEAEAFNRHRAGERAA